MDTSGNTETKTLSLKASLKVKKENRRVYLEAYYIYGETYGESTMEKIDVNNRWELRLNGFFPFWDIKYYRNPFQKYGYRLSTGPGLGYYFFKSEKTYLSASYYIQSHYDYLTGEVERYVNYTVHNMEARFRYKFDENLKFRQKVLYRLSDRQPGDYWVDFEVSIVNNLTKRLALELSYTANYQNKPVDPSVKRLDTTLSTFLVVRF
ncbi:MAG: hypothetical protein IEMM0002_0731 [bacterium]|nr:MAG: hypothetical protein IEMM0002_0731 [bacterium]